jgi:cyclase
MLRVRVIPSLLIRDLGLVKSVRFAKERYVGDPINAIKVFNDKQADELIALDISATKRGSINFELIGRINREAFMPLGYGGGIRSVDDVRRILGLGYEKVVIDSGALDRPELISEAASACGSSSVVACIDVKRDKAGRQLVYDYRTRKTLARLVREWADNCARLGAGEILLNDVDREGTFEGYDVSLISDIASRVTVPLVALGGAATLDDIKKAIAAGASAAAAGSMFVFHGPRKAVLITYPTRETLKGTFG